MRAISVLDPGHGGTVGIGRSTPYGVRGPNGLLEKNVTLALAQRVARRLGGAARLTRNGDVNLSLRDRARLSRELGSPLFLSIHANGGQRGVDGAEAWVHASATDASLALAEELRSELGRAGVPDRGLHRGDVAVLTPELHAPSCAACLIEVDHLDSANGARRLTDPRGLDALADGLATAVDRFLERGEPARGRSYSFGRAWSRGQTTLDLTDFPENVFVVIPDSDTPTVPRQIRTSDLDALKAAWDCMMRDQGLTLEGSATHKTEFRELLRGGLADSPFIRALFQEIACDTSHPLTMHVGRNQTAVFVDGFQYDPTLGSVAAGLNQAGHHTLDLADFDMLPRVSGNPRNYMQLRHQILVHALREARQGVLGNAYLASHQRAIDDENAFRIEQGQIGHKGYFEPTPVGGNLHWDLTHNGAVAMTELWHVSGADITSIDYSP